MVDVEPKDLSTEEMFCEPMFHMFYSGIMGDFQSTLSEKTPLKMTVRFGPEGKTLDVSLHPADKLRSFNTFEICSLLLKHGMLGLVACYTDVFWSLIYAFFHGETCSIPVIDALIKDAQNTPGEYLSQESFLYSPPPLAALFNVDTPDTLSSSLSLLGLQPADTTATHPTPSSPAHSLSSSPQQLLDHSHATPLDLPTLPVNVLAPRKGRKSDVEAALSALNQCLAATRSPSARPRAFSSPRKNTNRSDTKAERLEGHVTRLYPAGYGFAQCEKGSFFFHMLNVRNPDRMFRGVRVSFELKPGRKGLEAKEVEVLS